MGASNWLWVALIAFLIFCCVVPMLFMRKRGGRSQDAAKEEDQSSEK